MTNTETRTDEQRAFDAGYATGWLNGEQGINRPPADVPTIYAPGQGPRSAEERHEDRLTHWCVRDMAGGVPDLEVSLTLSRFGAELSFGDQDNKTVLSLDPTGARQAARALIEAADMAEDFMSRHVTEAARR
jgi:hypothetical protein